jgi:hypothetical protein
LKLMNNKRCNKTLNRSGGTAWINMDTRSPPPG